MKNTKYIITALLSLSIFFTSCEKYFEDETASPNDPVTVTPSLLLASAEVATFATYSGQLVRQSCVFSQHFAGTDAGSQSIEIANYVLTETTNSNEWETIYSGAVIDCRSIIENYGDANPYYKGIAKVIMALNIGIATDLWGDVPFTEAGFGNINDNVNPAFESQASILSGLSSLLDGAVSDLSVASGSNEFFPGDDDFIYGGDVDAWKRAARVIQARYANRLSELSPSSSADAVLSALSSDAMTGVGDDAMMPFSGGTNNINQWFDFESNRGGYYRINATFADMLVANNDPRLPFFLGEDPGGNYSGTPFDNTSNFNTSYVGDYYGTGSSPLPLVTYVEQKFLEAEARLRKGQMQEAADAHNEAVIASVEQVTADSAPAAFVTAFASEDNGSISLEKIMTQKWIAMFIQIETYSDWRRTGFPALTANPNANLSGIPLRLQTVQDERLYNSNVIVVSDVLSPVYWDQ